MRNREPHRTRWPNYTTRQSRFRATIWLRNQADPIQVGHLSNHTTWSETLCVNQTVCQSTSIGRAASPCVTRGNLAEPYENPVYLVPKPLGKAKGIEGVSEAPLGWAGIVDVGVGVACVGGLEPVIVAGA